MSDASYFYKRLIQPFPEEALSTDTSRGFDLTSVKAQYVIERLNEVFGMAGWRLTGEYKEVEGGVLYFAELSVQIGSEVITYTGEDDDDKTVEAERTELIWHTVEGVGFSHSKKNVGDTYKSARTDALSKAASILGVANDVFKGKVKPPSKGGGGGFKASKPAGYGKFGK